MGSQLRYSSINRISATVLLLSVMGCSGTDEPALATINGCTVGQQEFVREYTSFLFTTEVPDKLNFRFLLLESLIDEKLLLQMAEESGIRSTQEYISAAVLIENQLLLNAFYESELKIKLEPSEEQVRQLYRWSKQNLHARHLFARNRETIDHIYFQLQSGASWDSLAALHFQDPVLSTTGGDLGFFKLGDFDPAFESVAFELKDGEISSPVQTEYGYSIIQVIEREYDPFLTEYDYQIHKKWLGTLGRNYRKKAVVKKFTDELGRRLDIKINPQELNALYANLENVFSDKRESGSGADDAPLAIKANGQVWSHEQIITDLLTLSERQRKMIKSRDDLEVVIMGLVIRNNIIASARQMGLDKTTKFKTNFRDHTDNLVLRLALKPVYDLRVDENIARQAEIQRQAYFTLRDSLRQTANISIDTNQVKLIAIINPV